MESEGTLEFGICSGTQTRPLSADVEAHLSTQQNLRFQFELSKAEAKRLLTLNEELTKEVKEKTRENVKLTVEKNVLTEKVSQLEKKLAGFADAAEIMEDASFQQSSDPLASTDDEN